MVRVGDSPFARERGRKKQKITSTWRMDGLDTETSFLLKACPFCGKRPSVSLNPMNGDIDSGMNLMSIDISCPICGIHLKSGVIEDAIRIWNTRNESLFEHNFSMGALLGDELKKANPYVIRHGDPPAE